MTVNDKIIELLMNNNGKDGKVYGITNEELRTNNEVNSYRENSNITSGDFVKKAMKEVEETLDIAGYTLMKEKRGYNNKVTVFAAIPNDWLNPKMSDKEPYVVWDNVPKGKE